MIHGTRVGERAELEERVLVRRRNRARVRKHLPRARIVAGLEIHRGGRAREQRARDQRTLANLGQDAREDTRYVGNALRRD